MDVENETLSRIGQAFHSGHLAQGLGRNVVLGFAALMSFQKKVPRGSRISHQELRAALD